MASLRADRRLYLTADKAEVVELGDVRAAFLLAAEGRDINADDVARLGLVLKDGKVTQKGADKAVEVSDDKAVESAETKSEPADPVTEDPEEAPADGGEDEEVDARPDWPLKMDPDVYLERYPDGQHADLAREILG